ncbi:MAG TPA: 4-(cytidine 5'-diphospho)-2-C-methyl-D-erythritol kinase [Blastocatellia bacterium]|jgi:4-diphosphocytidyl-2-C-methyl-D-erythritol kinase|nr:4-(cytidine 5'-diphospho)-2-C-methyl-D-erythritol kinase [Blastocatellia bacterium]
MAIQLRSYAKINWTLDVLFRREDGFHEIRTIYQTVSLYDRLILTRTSGEIAITCDNASVPCDGTNLAHRAAVLLRDESGVDAGVHIEILKRIPVAGGLGGGSSNAGAVLQGLTRLWEIETPDSRLLELASSLGSDVPFFLSGGTALGVGRGEEVYPLEEISCGSLLLVNSGISVPTGAIYEKLCRLTRKEAVRIIPLTLLAAKGIRELPLAASNDLEEVVEAAYPEIAEVKRRLLSLGARRALMSGSGGTVFGLFDNLHSAGKAREEVRAAGWWAEAVRTVDRKEYRSTIFEAAI